MLETAFYHWEWDCRVILRLPDKPSPEDIEKAYQELSRPLVKVLDQGSTSKLRQKYSSEARKLQRIQDAYEHLKYLVRTGAKLPSIPDWARWVRDRERDRPSQPPTIASRHSPILRRHARSTTVSLSPMVSSRLQPVSERIPPTSFDRFQPPAEALRRKMSSQKLRRKSSKASSATSRTSVGSQVSDSSVSGVVESLEAMNDLVRNARDSLKKRKTKTLRFNAPGSPFREVLPQAVATNKSLLEIVDAMLTRVEHYQAVHKLVQASVEDTCRSMVPENAGVLLTLLCVVEDHKRLVRLYDSMQKQLKDTARLDPTGADKLLATLRREDYAGRLDAILRIRRR
ncbi:hypothetical protein CONLIGDRAFT_469228 [Coniochaeta ligniaria NRRL 30616]|uniref:J domain-containing protein n=1 Tax=Coniochaeta ligniaria NRRL 30616 TaxID=1408157 RepID=A0A1J7JFD4_9PEZI|nr:hypothetical protein CONLIGDRAFT_469228 [Coniochaeta ligniaria NRRL 30616]